MYAQVGKRKENKSRAVANSVAQKKRGVKQDLGFVDNRVPVSHNIETIQRIKTVTVTNTINNYDSGWVQSETLSQGVEAGPRAEAQAVAKIAGGSWVGGHMVNDRLGGSGGFSNIVPITSSMNNKHHTIENDAQKKVGNGGTPYEVRYYMAILHRDDYTFTPSGDKVNNLADQFQQSYEWRTKEVQAGGSSGRPRPYQAPGPITRVNGAVLDMD